MAYRTTGELISARQYADTVNWAKGIDLTSDPRTEHRRERCSTHAVTDAGCDVGNATGFSRAGKVEVFPVG
jgi:hypothetical protein